MNELKIFENPEFGKIRAVEKDGEPWLVGKDVAALLGYSDTAQAIRNHVDDEDKGVVEMTTPGGKQKIQIINESGLYSLVLSSKLPNARKLKRWVTAEVLPSIRKHGAYMTPDTIDKILTDPDTLIKLATTLKEERKKRAALEAQAKADRPKVLFADSVSASKSFILIGKMAKLLKQNGVYTMQNRFSNMLRERGYRIKWRFTGYNMPTQQAMELGLFLEIKETVINHSDGHTSVNKTPKITGKGSVYFMNLFATVERRNYNE